jgi:hypothetical protein
MCTSTNSPVYICVYAKICVKVKNKINKNFYKKNTNREIKNNIEIAIFLKTKLLMNSCRPKIKDRRKPITRVRQSIYDTIDFTLIQINKYF